MREKKAEVSSFLIAVILLTVVVIAGAHQPPTQAAPCLYGYEWLHRFRFPLQADPHGSYSYVVVPKLPAGGEPVGFLVDAESRTHGPGGGTSPGSLLSGELRRVLP